MGQAIAMVLRAMLAVVVAVVAVWMFQRLRQQPDVPLTETFRAEYDYIIGKY